MNLDLNQFLNVYDVCFLLICIVSIFFGVKNGLVKSLFNIFKWIIIFYLVKNCFNFLRPMVDQYITNQTISDILIFLFTIITSYIFLSFMNRLIIGILQPKKSGLADIGFGAILGIIRGYIVFVLIIFFLNNNISINSMPWTPKNGSFNDIINYGVELLDHIPREIDEIS